MTSFFIKTTFLLFTIFLLASCQTRDRQIVISKQAGSLELYASRELQRYIYQLTGDLLEITHRNDLDNVEGFVIGRLGKSEFPDNLEDKYLNLPGKKPGSQGYVLKKIKLDNSELILIGGADPEGCLYGVYGLLDDHYDMGFYFSGDTYPDKTNGLSLVDVDEVKTPATYIRGILPWTNFPQAATSYSWDDWTYVIDQMARMRMNFIHIHNYSGGADHNEMFANFEYKNHRSRVWMATTKTGHGWSCPGWDVNKYRFGSSHLFDDYDFGADCALHNETLSNEEVFRKGVSEFQRVIAYAHVRGVKIGLGLDINQIPKEYEVEANNPLVVKARAEQIANDYPDLDYLLCFQSEHIARDEVARLKWRGIFDAFYHEIKEKSLQTKVAVSGWGLAAKDVTTLPKDVICAPIASYTADFESGAIYGDREYWGCPWLEKDGDCSQYYYPYTINLSNTIEGWQKRATNLKGLYSLTWRMTDAIDPKISYIAKAPWDDQHKYGSSKAVYHEYAEDNYGMANADVITQIINENEPWVDSQGECRPTLEFSRKAKRGRANICKVDYFQFLSNDKNMPPIQAESFSSKDGWVKAEEREDGTECIGNINSADWLAYPKIDFAKGMNQIKYRTSSKFFNSSFELRLDSLEGKLLQTCQMERTFGWDAWKEQISHFSEVKGCHDVYLIFHPAPERNSEIVKANRQLSTIDSCLKERSSSLDKDRLKMLRCRIAATRDNLILNRDFETYEWSDLPGTMESFIDNFNYRINDISSLGTIMSVQNRFVSQNYEEKEQELYDREKIKPIRYLEIKGTLKGAILNWTCNQADVKGFYIYRDGHKINQEPLSANLRTWEDEHNGRSRYAVSVLYEHGEESKTSIPHSCYAGNSDSIAPHIVMVSPPTSVISGQPAWFKVRLLEGRAHHLNNAQLYYRRPGDEEWNNLNMERRVKSVFTAQITNDKISAAGLEYYIVANDGSNESRFPSEGMLSLSSYNLPFYDRPNMPNDVRVDGNKIIWEPLPADEVLWYRIYRDVEPDFEAGPATLLTYVEKNTNRFYDNAYNLDGGIMEGTWYYRISSLNKMGFESEASEPVEINASQLVKEIKSKKVKFVANEVFRKEASRKVN